MIVYVDSSAVIKRGIREAETDQLLDELERWIVGGDRLMSSSLALVEVHRAMRSRLELEAPARVVDLIELALSGIEVSPMDESVVSLARRLGPGSLRSLDAIHLATAVLLDADLVVAYDSRLVAAAEELGFASLSPGHVEASSR